MTDSEIRSYLGIPWQEGARGPEAYDCWGLLMHILNKFYCREIPEIPLEHPELCMAIAKENFESGKWTQVTEPLDGDAVLLRGGLRPHVGIWLENDQGGVLHSMNGMGVLFSSMRDLRVLQFPRVKYYRVAS